MVPEPPSITDEELARQAQAGSFAAYEHLVQRYEVRVLAFATQILRNATDAREVTQDTFVKAFQKLGQYHPDRSFAAWLFTIARRKCVDCFRAAPPVSDDSVPEQSDDNDPAELTARREEGQNLWRLAREVLGDNQFQALWLHYAEDMDVNQTAQVMGKTRVHVRVLLFRARQLLAQKMMPGPVPANEMQTAVLNPEFANLTIRSSTQTRAK